MLKVKFEDICIFTHYDVSLVWNFFEKRLSYHLKRLFGQGGEQFFLSSLDIDISIQETDHNQNQDQDQDSPDISSPIRELSPNISARTDGVNIVPDAPLKTISSPKGIKIFAYFYVIHFCSDCQWYLNKFFHWAVHHENLRMCLLCPIACFWSFQIFEIFVL